MIVYNVTCNIPEDIEAEWVHWMKHEHIPEVISTEKFTGYRMLKLLTVVDDNEGVNYAIQYFCNTIDDFNEYVDKFALALKAKTYEKYGDKVLAFRTLLEEV